MSSETPLIHEELPAGRPSVPRRRRIFAILFAIAVILIVLLRYSAMIVVVEPTGGSADFAIVGDWECGQCYRVVSDRIQSGSLQGILLFFPERKRIVALGAAEPFEVECRENLIADGLNPSAIQFIHGTSRNDWDTARLIENWLGDHPDKRLVTICNRFSSRRWSCILDQTISEPLRSRLILAGVVDPRYDDTNWWRSRTGIKCFFGNAFRLGYAYWHGEDRLTPIDWSPEKYESAVLK